MEKHEHKHNVNVFIDQKLYESPNSTTGAALYALGNVQVGLELYREVTGDKEDQPVENGLEMVRLKEDEHFHSGSPKVYTIIVNGQKKTVTTRTLTFAEIIALAFPTLPTGPNTHYTVFYEDGPRTNLEGSLQEGEGVRVNNGMIFNVTKTDKS
jgi:hypothetical protein